MAMLTCMLVLGSADVVLVAYAWRKRDRCAAYGSPPLHVALALFAAAFAVHTVAAVPLARVLGMQDAYGRAMFIWIFLSAGVLPMWCYGRIVLEVLANVLAELVFGMRTVRPMRLDFERARGLMLAGDTERAVRLYRSYFEEAPDDPQPLFELARLFERMEQPENACAIYREILRRFQGHATQWAKAAYFLALQLEGDMADPQTAIYLYEDIVRKAPKTTYAQFSQQRLAEALRPTLN